MKGEFMKLDELKKIAKENDYTLWSTSDNLYQFKRKFTMKLIHIGKREIGRIYFHNFDMCDDKDFNMINACMDFSHTNPNDREEEKKFYLRHKFLTSSMGEITQENSFINYNTRDKVMYLADKPPIGCVKTIFTLKEIEEIKEKFDTDLADFELVEVEE